MELQIYLRRWVFSCLLWGKILYIVLALYRNNVFHIRIILCYITRATAIIPGFNGNDGTTKFIIRFLATIMFGLGLYEIEHASSKATQDIFIKYHALCSALTLWTMKELGGKGMNWFSPVLITSFLVGGIVAK